MLKRKRFRRWLNRLSVHQTKKHTNNKQQDEAFYELIDDQINAHAEVLLFREEYKKMNTIEYRCFSCKKTINIDVKNMIKHHKPLHPRAFYCMNCQPKKLTSTIRYNPVLLRYMNSFYTKVRNKIKYNIGDISDFL